MIAQRIEGLNLGSRNRSIEGFLNMDIDQHPGVDVVGDVSDLSRFNEESIPAIYVSHVIEHFQYHRTLAILKEWARVLEPGGKLYIAVPDFERCVELYGILGLNEWIVRFLMGDQEYKTAYHYNLFDEARLKTLLDNAGFSESFRVEQFPFGDENDCSNLVSNIDNLPVSLNFVAIK